MCFSVFYVYGGPQLLNWFLLSPPGGNRKPNLLELLSLITCSELPQVSERYYDKAEWCKARMSRTRPGTSQLLVQSANARFAGSESSSPASCLPPAGTQPRLSILDWHHLDPQPNHAPTPSIKRSHGLGCKKTRLSRANLALRVQGKLLPSITVYRAPQAPRAGTSRSLARAGRS